MSTFVTIEVVGHDANDSQIHERDEHVDRAFDWFSVVEQRCTRFNPASELMQLTARIGVPVAVSPMLYEAVRFAIAVAAETSGAFDPTIGQQMARRGFNRDYQTGDPVESTARSDDRVTYRDVGLDEQRRTIMLQRPLVLDLGAVAKGLAIDMAARELRPLTNFAIDAGGDLYLAGRGPDDAPWSVGIRHPRDDHQWVDSFHVSDKAVCTSGDYERRSGDGHHILDPRSGSSAATVTSATVVAPSAMVADALATAAFVLGPIDGIRLLEHQGVEGVLLSATLDRYATTGFPHG